MSDQRPLLRTAAAAAYLATRGIEVAVFTLNDWRICTPPRGPKFVKIAKRVYYRPEDLDAWIDDQIEEQLGASAAAG